MHYASASASAPILYQPRPDLPIRSSAPQLLLVLLLLLLADHQMDVPASLTSVFLSSAFPHVVLLSHVGRRPLSLSLLSVSLHLPVNQTWPASSCIPEAALHLPGSVYGQTLDIVLSLKSWSLFLLDIFCLLSIRQPLYKKNQSSILDSRWKSGS